MRKLSILGGVLLILSFLTATNVNAKSLPAISISATTDDLSDRLAADKDFQEFSNSTYDLISKVQSTKSGTLFLKYFQKTISDAELVSLLENLKYSNKADFSDALRKIYTAKLKISQKFSEIAIDNNKDAVIAAAKKVVIDAAKPNPHTSGDCWAFFTAALAACSQGCDLYASDYETCLSICFMLASAAASDCFFTAD